MPRENVCYSIWLDIFRGGLVSQLLKPDTSLVIIYVGIFSHFLTSILGERRSLVITVATNNLGKLRLTVSSQKI